LAAAALPVGLGGSCCSTEAAESTPGEAAAGTEVGTVTGVEAAIEAEIEVGTLEWVGWVVEGHGSWPVESIIDPISVVRTHRGKLRLHYNVCGLED
jgi:hypothetical protein